MLTGRRNGAKIGALLANKGENKMFAYVLFGGVLGVCLTKCGLHVNDWKFWVIMLALNTLFAAANKQK